MKKLNLTLALMIIIGIKVFPQDQNSTGDLKIRVNGPEYYDETYIRFIEPATNLFDNNFDAYKLFGLNNEKPYIYTRGENNLLIAINSLPILKNEIKIPLYSIFGMEGNHQLRFPIRTNFNPDYFLYIKDELTGQQYNLAVDTIINFYAAETGVESNRFTLYLFPRLKLMGTNNITCNMENSGMAVIGKSNSEDWEYNMITPEGKLINRIAMGNYDTIMYLKQGNYKIITGTGLTYQEITFSINLSNPLKADFEINYITDKEYQFKNNSNNHQHSYWTFGEGGSSIETSPINLFKTTGNFIISLVISNGICTDTISKSLNVELRSTSDNFLNTPDFELKTIENKIIVINRSSGHLKIQVGFFNLNGQAMSLISLNLPPFQEEILFEGEKNKILLINGQINSSQLQKVLYF